MSGVVSIDDDSSEESLEVDEKASVGGPLLYNESCSSIVKKLLKLNGELFLFHPNKALFVPRSIFEMFIVKMLKVGISIEDQHIWDYDLRIGDKTKPMQLIWIVGHNKGSRIPFHEEVRYAFNFLQPHYLRYLDKPFWNPNLFTQVNLVLDYYRTQKRKRGIEIFNICDLIKFKMAIDDNRREYENCEFHKLIDRTLTEVIQSGIYMKDGKFDLNEYLGDKLFFRNVQEIFEYLVYHFQQTIGSLHWSAYAPYSIQLSNIYNVPDFLDGLHATGIVVVRETDSSGKCSEVLYEILSTSRNFIDLKFTLDCEWIYGGNNGFLNEMIDVPARCQITIDTKNSFNFIENFVNWLKLAFGTQTKYFIELRLKTFETINPYIFNGLHLKELEIRDVTLDARIIRMLRNCDTGCVYFINCRIANDINERYEFIGRQSSGGDHNIFKVLDDLHNVGFIKLEFEEHTIGTLFAYVATVMSENNLMEFQIKNQMWFPDEYKLTFIRSHVNTDLDQIEAYSRKTGDKIDFYELLNHMNLTVRSDRENFDFYE